MPSNRRKQRKASKPRDELGALSAALSELLNVLDVRKLKPGKLIAVLNSTPLGECISASKLTRHRQRAGLRIGDDKTIDLVRYAAWLAITRARSAAGRSDATGYEAHRLRMAEAQREKSRLARDIGELPPVADPDRRKRCSSSLRTFCETYLSRIFYLPWSDEHLDAIATVERTTLAGGLYSLSMPRGFGKTMICEAGALWGLVNGHREYIVILGPTDKHATDRIESLKVELEGNDLLGADYPEICFPIRRLEGIYQRRLMYRGQTIRLQFTSTMMVLANLNAPKFAGSIIETSGLTGQIRGMNFKRDDGTSIRPDMVLLDDPQKDEQAKSPSQVDKLESIIRGAVLGLAGPGRSMSAVMPCTVICRDDLADRFLDRERNPQWRGKRTKMLRALPTNEKLWNEYAKQRREGQATGHESELGNAFYLKRRVELDEGGLPSWPHRFDADEHSAIQHAMNIKIDRGDRAFFAECQNDPMPEHGLDDELLTASEISEKVNGYGRRTIPMHCSVLTAFVDVQDKILFWMVCAWQPNFTGYVVDYGTDPDQKLAHFNLREIRRTLQQAAPRSGPEGATLIGLTRLVDRLRSHDWKSETGASLNLDQVLIDAGYRENVVFQYARSASLGNLVLPSRGRYVGASTLPFSDYVRRPGEKVGENWRIPPVAGKRASRHVLFDSNFWKSFVHSRLSTSLGDPGCLSLYGRKAEQHQMLAAHLAAEFRVRTTGRGRTIDEWKCPPGVDNHWFDCLVGCAVAASMSGVSLDGIGAKRVRRRVKYSDLIGSAAGEIT